MRSLLNSVRAGCCVGDRAASASIGVAHAADVGADTSFESLYPLLAGKLYDAKHSGRDRTVRQRGQALPPKLDSASEPSA